jgi:uncharacterized membrane protein (DUF485 family)
MLHEPATPAGKDPAGPYKIRLGIRMVIFYSLFYASFVAINLLNPLAMETIVLAGLNLATVYGFALIIVALIEALIYDWLCRKKEAYYEEIEKSKGTRKKTKPSRKGRA